MLSLTAAAELREIVLGDVITPEHAAYEDARKVWNGVIDRRPAAIVRPTSAREVAAAIGFARAHGLELAVRGGGHAYAGGATCDDGLVIDLSAMRDVSVDPAAKTASAGGGALWADVDAATQEHGLALTGGFISHTGIGGLTLGGGMGWLVRKTGLSCDSLIAAEVVTADGRILRASGDDNAELFWALRGGGGNFGVVTRFEFQLHDAGPLVHLALSFWTADRGAEAIKFARDYIPRSPANVQPFLIGLSAPPAPFIPEHLHFAPGWALLVTGFGEAAEHEAALEPVRAAKPDVEFVTPIPYVNLQQLFNEGNGHGSFGYEKALYLTDLSDGAVDVLVEGMRRPHHPLTGIPIFVLDGAYASVPDDATAFAGRRVPSYVVNIAAGTPPGERDAYEADREWVRRLWSELLPHASGGSGSYVNFMSEYEEDRVRQAFGPAKYERLLRIKREYDPENVFHRMAANIKP